MTSHQQEPGAPTSPAPLTCYRHPGRETAIRCTRCDRPICPDCMRDAPVGFQCPECVREGRPPRTRTSFGGAVSRRPGVVTMTLIAINVVAFLLEQGRPQFEIRFEQINAAVAVNHDYYRLLTATFLHAGWWHIGLNMYALYLMGPIVEQALGRWRYLGLYLACGLAGSAFAYALMPLNSAVVGASGSIYGLFAALWIVARRLRLDTSQIVGVIAINFALSFFIRNISWQGHLGGFLAGIAIAAVYAYAPRRVRTPAHVAVLLAITAIAMGGALWRTHSVVPMLFGG